jgi:hypothetical protein
MIKEWLRKWLGIYDIQTDQRAYIETKIVAVYSALNEVNRRLSKDIDQCIEYGLNGQESKLFALIDYWNLEWQPEHKEMGRFVKRQEPEEEKESDGKEVDS